MSPLLLILARAELKEANKEEVGVEIVQHQWQAV